MQRDRPDRLVRALTALVSVAYFVFWAGALLALLGAPLARLFAGDNADWVWVVKVPTNLHDSQAAVLTGWGEARLTVEHARGELILPIARMPWRVVALLWMHAAVVIGLLLLCLHQLRRIFQRVRDGIPFDESNALRVRRLGLLLLALALFNAVAEFATALAMRHGLTGGSITLATAPHIDLPVVFVALVLVALAEVFHRGALLEHEQSLVV